MSERVDVTLMMRFREDVSRGLGALQGRFSRFGRTLEANESQISQVGQTLGVLGGGLTALLFLAARSADSQGEMAQQTQRLREQLGELGRTVGEAVLPVMLRLLEVANRILDIITRFPEPVLKIGAAFAGVIGVLTSTAAAILLIASAIGKIMPALRALFGAQSALRALMGGPLGIAAVAGAIAVGVGASAAFDRFASLQTGGIVRRPTLALVGEAGPEAVVPLGRGGGGIGGVTVVFNEPAFLDDEFTAQRFAERVRTVLRQEERR